VLIDPAEAERLIEKYREKRAADLRDWLADAHDADPAVHAVKAFRALLAHAYQDLRGEAGEEALESLLVAYCALFDMIGHAYQPSGEHGRARDLVEWELRLFCLAAVAEIAERVRVDRKGRLAKARASVAACRERAAWEHASAEWLRNVERKRFPEWAAFCDRQRREGRFIEDPRGMLRSVRAMLARIEGDMALPAAVDEGVAFRVRLVKKHRGWKDRTNQEPLA
jgi:hypothetical protein